MNDVFWLSTKITYSYVFHLSIVSTDRAKTIQQLAQSLTSSPLMLPFTHVWFVSRWFTAELHKQMDLLTSISQREL